MGKKIKRQIFRLLPKSIQHTILRMNLNLSSELPEGLSFKIAETQSELEQAFCLVHENYFHLGLIEAEKEKLRITKFHAVPGTVVLIGKIHDQVVATLTVVLDGPLGLPSDSGFELQALRDNGYRICEISSLAIKREYQKLNGKLLFPLIHCMRKYTADYMAADVIVAVVNRKTKPFYEGILDFKALKRKSGKYQYVKDDKPSGQYLTLFDMEERYKAIYGGQVDKLNIHKYFFENSFKQCQFPDRKFHKITDIVMNSEQLNYFFKEKSSVFKNMEESEKRNLKYEYFHSKFAEIIDPDGVIPVLNQRSEPRFSVKCRGTIVIQNKEIQQVDIQSVGRSGLLVQSKWNVVPGQSVQIQFSIGENQLIKIGAKAVWENDDGKIGLMVTQHPNIWSEYINYLEKELYDKAAVGMKLAVNG